MKRMKWLYCLIIIIAIFHPSNVQASAQAAPQIVYLGSEVGGPDIVNNYLVSCEIEGDIRLNVEFLGGRGV